MSRPRVLVLAALVIVGFAVGGLAVAKAWATANATPMLTVAVVLVLAGVFGDRITQLTAKWGDKEVGITVAEKNAQLARDLDNLADDQETPEPIRQELRRLGDEAESVATVASSAASRSGSSLASHRSSPYVATHLIGKQGEAALTLELPGAGMTYSLFGLTEARCTVTTKSGVSATTQVNVEARRPFGAPVAEVRWPDDFPDMEQPRPGKYFVDWHVKQLGLAAYAALMGSPWRRVAIDSFEIHG